ncbi:hypothetical protein MNBD_GAMMA12-500 [hydrothermal vent metagenome]|uniref:Uncharacterized protein n=1 Tax=hydrothermal vent metagenome TaxID=652676 RepID=A0A3B0XZX0_9ZZZZ
MHNSALRSKVTPIVPEKPSFSFKDGVESVTLDFDSRYLFEHRSGYFGSNSNVWLLHDLSPFLTPQSTTHDHLKSHSLTALSFGLAALIVLFSVINPLLPLLAPILALASFTFASYTLIGLKRKYWICVNSDDGMINTRIKIDNADHSKMASRQLFESKLSEAIDAAKQKEYYYLD